jgi:hypothetical protein
MNNMAKELKKSCPFCNIPTANLYLIKHWIDGDEYTEIFCNRCKISFRLEDSAGDTEVNEKQLIDFWNKERGTDKLSQLEDLAEQIGCPLDFVATPYKLSGLKKIWYHNQWCEVVRIVVNEEATKPYMEVRCKDYKYLKMILLEDYGKT